MWGLVGSSGTRLFHSAAIPFWISRFPFSTSLFTTTSSSSPSYLAWHLHSRASKSLWFGLAS